MPGEPADVTLYWRPRCPYCIRLRWQVRRARLAVREVNIWKDPEAAARVRAVTGGDETVPTVTVGTAALVNPSIAELLTAIGDQGRLCRGLILISIRCVCRN